MASLRAQDPALNQKALNALRWRLPGMERDPYTYPTRARALALTQPD